MATEATNTIEQVVRSGLCTGCGTCVGICPRDAVQMAINNSKGIYVPQLDKERCNECGLCYEACPGHSVDFKQLNLEIFGKEPNDILLGNYLSCYIGHATDYDIRYNSASGGLVTALLIFALEEGLIDGALVTRMRRDRPLEPQSFIARTREEMVSASKSKYCPVPANIALKGILEAKEGEKFAVVGLPCHLHGIRKAEQVNKKLKERLLLHLGIFCSHTPNFWGTELLLKRLNIKRDDVVKLDYRGEGWPGSMRISQKGGEILLLPDYWGFTGLDFFTPARCLMCSDQTSELADCSFADAWLPSLSDKIGKSIVIARTEVGEQFLVKAIAKKVVELDGATGSEVKRSQMVTLYFKKKSLKARLNLFRRKPLYAINLPKPNFIDYPLSVFTWFNRLLSQNKVLRGVLECSPRRFLSLYNLPFNVIYSKKAQGFHSKPPELVLEPKPFKIVVTNHGSKLNKGNQALLTSRVKTLRKLIPDAAFTVFTYAPEIENELQDVNILEVIGRISLPRTGKILKKNIQTVLYLLKCSLWSILHRCLHLDIGILRMGKGLTEYYDADVIMSTGGDLLTEDYGTFSFLTQSIPYLFALLLSKPVVLYAESIGPFKRWWNRIVARFLLNRVKLITLREGISQKYLEDLQINKTPTYVTADSAFLLEPAPAQRVKEILEKEGIKESNRPLVGISASKLISRYGFDDLNTITEKYHRYVELMAQLTDHLSNALNATVVFVPHVIELSWGNDDRIVADDICALITNKQGAVSIRAEYTTEEIKGIIGQCDLFVGARMHATIAATSMYVPTVAIAYSHKTYGIIGEMLGYKRYVLDIKNLNSHSLISVVDEVYKNRVEIKRELELRIESVKQRAWLNGELLMELTHRRALRDKTIPWQ